MSRTTLTIGEKEHPLKGYSYRLVPRYRLVPHTPVEKTTIVSINVELHIPLDGKNDLDSDMLKKPFDCTVKVYDAYGKEASRELTFESAYIDSFHENALGDPYLEIRMNAIAVTINGRHFTTKNPYE